MRPEQSRPAWHVENSQPLVTRVTTTMIYFGQNEVHDLITVELTEATAGGGGGGSRFWGEWPPQPLEFSDHSCREQPTDRFLRRAWDHL